MIYYKNFKGYEKNIQGKRKKYDNNIFTFDIESTSYITYKDKIYNSLFYDTLNEKEKEEATPRACMYIWMLGINDIIYYGRTWEEFIDFLNILDKDNPVCKIIYIHNLSFEFQFLKSIIKFNKVFARKSHKVIKAECQDYNIEFKCSYMLSNTKLDNLTSVYNLPVKKLVGNLDYSKLRHSETILTEEELAYCENDCLVLYHYIKFELNNYKLINKIPLTSTGHVRRELKEKTEKNYKYKSLVRRSINVDPHVYNLLLNAFQGGYTHANWIYTDEVLKNIDSYDEISAYPYVMTTYKFPATTFKKSFVRRYEDMSKNFAYLLHVKFYNIKSKYSNNFISSSKCMMIKGAKYDNGRIMSANYFEMIITDIDFYLYLDSYSFEYEIIECYYSVYKYLPKDFINFILEKYVKKTEYKGLEEKSIEYTLEKNKFNALYGMSVTNIIKDEVIFEDGNWEEIPMTNEEIKEKLKTEKKKAFLSFSYGVWITAYARDNLLRRVMELDEYTVYCDTDSIKLLQGYDKRYIDNYNKEVLKRINNVSKKLGIEFNKFSPLDKKGNRHTLGLFELEKKDYQLTSYKEFITQGAKKYAYKENDEFGNDKIKITVAGVPKSGAKALKDLKDFKDGLIFRFKDTNKNLLFYCENQNPILIKDYLGNDYIVSDISGCSLMPNTYSLGKSLDYAHLLSDDSSKRNYYREEK